MSLLSMIPFVVAAGIVFITINIMTPILYEFWFNNLQSQTTGALTLAGDRAFGMWQIMSYIVPGLIILWGFALAQRQRVSERQDEF